MVIYIFIDRLLVHNQIIENEEKILHLAKFNVHKKIWSPSSKTATAALGALGTRLGCHTESAGDYLMMLYFKHHSATSRKRCAFRRWLFSELRTARILSVSLG